eukprot:TRINITY_DN15714_c0_g1_i1.p1 TRINITY_DN15714_c0_g1~~TRINITY_DN15714_c0_g1_i1.p1  ORF type:complete len:319 (-),score=52.78 TRINITY_DN15714_c0_g1_i1:355-1311(-)
MWFPSGARPAAAGAFANAGCLQGSFKDSDSMKDSLKANLQQVAAMRRPPLNPQPAEAARPSQLPGSLLISQRPHRRMFKAAGRSLMRSESVGVSSPSAAGTSAACVGYSAAASRDGLLGRGDEELGDTFKRVRAHRVEETWQQGVRASIKAQSRRRTEEPRSPATRLPSIPRSLSSGSIPSPSAGSVQQPMSSAMGMRPNVASLLLPAARPTIETRPEAFAEQDAAIEARLRQRAEKPVNAKARMSACYEDLISFLEMNGLSGAYALAFSATGVGTLEKLLTMNEDELSKVIKACDMDAMDEILLLGALRGSRMTRGM